MQDKNSRLMEYEKEKELVKIRNLLIEKRMIFDTTRPKKRTNKSLVEITNKITDISPTMQKALNFDEIQNTVVKHFDFQVKDIVNYMLGNKEILFSKLRIVDPEGFESAKKKSDLSEFTHQELELSEKEDPHLPKPKNNFKYMNYQDGPIYSEKMELDGQYYKQIHLTDGYYNLNTDYDYLEGKKVNLK